MSTEGPEEVEVPRSNQRVTVAGAGAVTSGGDGPRGILSFNGSCLEVGLGGDLRLCRRRLFDRRGHVHSRSFTARRLEVYQLEVDVKEAVVTSAIDDLIQQKGLSGVIDYQPLRQSASPRRLSQLIRLQYFLETGGDWTGNVALIHLAKNHKQHKRIQQLPIQLDEGDVEQVGLRETFESRGQCLGQWSLIGRRCGLGCGPEGIHLSGLVASEDNSPASAGAQRIAALMAQPSRVWDSCCCDFTDWSGRAKRLVILCGDKAGDPFSADIEMCLHPGGRARIALHSTEEPRGDGVGVAGSPQTVALARTKMGSDAWLIRGVSEATSTGVSKGGVGANEGSSSHSRSPRQPRVKPHLQQTLVVVVMMMLLLVAIMALARRTIMDTSVR
ncbi:unnamed protein product [Vitrella brassicaformis CCMP3155]|uniref:Uncharacterized protein n=1 Tax=Vitrella brassicaformis (strain CCMP3155) TaxID=1169540 RepID=A0A0G4FIW2_VITBC|nr:unnamed protein product [Vitrella brassicaformis CCMP3155]|eukprot:CEM13698.1 unnamed protein product [Vitrella brassicaformis CCMP3155]